MRHNISLISSRCFSLPVKIRVLFFFAILFLLTTTPSNSATQTQQQKLEQLKNQIQQLQSELKADNKQKDKAVYLLQTAEKDVAAASKKLRVTERDFSISQKKLASLNNQESNLKVQLQENRDALISQIRAAYSMGKQEYVKLLLNQENPATLSRMVVYYQYFNQSRADRLQHIDKRLLRLKKVSREIERQSEKLLSLKKLAFNEREILKSKRSQRTEVVASLSASLRKKNQALNSMLRDEQHLKKLLQRIESQLKDVQLDLAPPKEFRQMKGQLIWPTTGTIASRFGSLRKNSGKLKWKGVVIETDVGNTIKAVAYGRVVFADWLRGFGMLLIIDHGSGYMSLYGHNEQLHKKMGDWVQANETIATSGNSGGHIATSLYFEIRHNGKPQDPVKWCKSLPKRS